MCTNIIVCLWYDTVHTCVLHTDKNIGNVFQRVLSVLRMLLTNVIVHMKSVTTTVDRFML